MSKRVIDWRTSLIFLPLAVLLGILTAYASEIRGTFGKLVLAVVPLLFVALFLLVQRLAGRWRPRLLPGITRRLVLGLVWLVLSLAVTQIARPNLAVFLSIAVALALMLTELLWLGKQP
jgi:uncharacterized membrane protein